MENKLIIIMGIFVFIFLCGCLTNQENSQSADSQYPEGAKEIKGNEAPSDQSPQPGMNAPADNGTNGDKMRPLPGDRNDTMRGNETGIGPRPGWNDTGRGNGTGMIPGQGWNGTEIGNMSERLSQMREMLGLPENASEEDVRKALEERGMQPPGNPPENPPNN